MELPDGERVSSGALLKVGVYERPVPTHCYRVEIHRTENIPSAWHPGRRHIETVLNHPGITVNQHRRAANEDRGLRWHTLANAAVRALDNRVACDDFGHRIPFLKPKLYPELLW